MTMPKGWKPKPELKASQIIRNCIGKYKKIEWKFASNGGRCILGAMMSEFGWDGKERNEEGYWQLWNSVWMKKVIKSFGLEYFITGWDYPDIIIEVVKMNNTSSEDNWAEIADYVEKQGH